MKDKLQEREQGSGLFLVIIIASALSIGIYSLLGMVNNEFRLNKRAALHNEAKNAAEALLQASLADLMGRFEQRTSFPVDALSPSKNPLRISNEFVGLHAGEDSNSRLIIPAKLSYSSANEFNSQETEIIGGQVPPGDWRYIDPRIPGNEFDPLAGTRVFERNIELLSKATTEDPNLGRSTVRARQTLQVRDAPLFAYAIFYNIPMEIAPGPRMDIYGNVHSNGASWFQSNNALNFHNRVTVAGDFHHGRHPDSGMGGSNGAVRFPDSEGNLVNMRKDGSWPSAQSSAFTGNWLTSNYSNFYDLSNQLWGGNVQTGRHGVLPQNPVGVSDYIEDTNPNTSAKEAFNSAYQLIQPVLNASELAIPSQSSDPDGHRAAVARNEVENQKYAYQAGLTVQLAEDGSINFFTYERDGSGAVQYDSDGEPVRIFLEPYTSEGNEHPGKGQGHAHGHDHAPGNAHGYGLYGRGWGSEDSIARFRPFREVDSTIESGLHDKRQAQDLNIVELDVGRLKELVHSNDRSNWGGNQEQTPENWWNGIVYVEFATENPTSTRPDGVNPAKQGYGLKLINGETIPNPSFAHDRDIYGLSVATNQMMYVEGHYNADGNFNTGSPTSPDNSGNFAREGREAPAALIADSITFLSTNWDDANSNTSLSNRRAAHTEISAAILTGNVPSGKTGSNRYSGGVENFPRFLENWSGRDLRIRGSMVALFESEVGTRGWGYGDVYNAPRREWGFHEKFAEGYLPPGTPNTRRYRAIDFQLVTQEAYEEHLHRVKNYF